MTLDLDPALLAPAGHGQHSVSIGMVCAALLVSQTQHATATVGGATTAASSIGEIGKPPDPGAAENDWNCTG
jgi:hypothetical protein